MKQFTSFVKTLYLHQLGYVRSCQNLSGQCNAQLMFWIFVLYFTSKNTADIHTLFTIHFIPVTLFFADNFHHSTSSCWCLLPPHARECVRPSPTIRDLWLPVLEKGHKNPHESWPHVCAVSTVPARLCPPLYNLYLPILSHEDV